MIIWSNFDEPKLQGEKIIFDRNEHHANLSDVLAQWMFD